ncbi:MAG: asparagine--tRNA ligase, partial [Chlorobiales bacterium]|nr:asparagine--tRNA ligase [Chlorobiales bacterium]
MIHKERTKIKLILETPPFGEKVVIWGWAKTARSGKNVSFVELNDGSSLNSLQVVIDSDKLDEYSKSRLLTGSCMRITGTVAESPGKGQSAELQADSIEIVGPADEKFPIQKKKHTMEYLRTVPHLRAKTNTFLAVFRMRNELAFAVHNFYQERGFVYVHTPVITSSDAEGAGEMFRITTWDMDKITAENKYEASKDFFGKSAFLTVSGQLEGETFAQCFGEIYTFGPTFRAENSNTSRHVSEFWMIEPEMAFYDFDDLLELAEDFIKYITRHVWETCQPEIKLLTRFYEPELENRYRTLMDNDFGRVTFHEALELLTPHSDKFEFQPSAEEGLFSEHEKLLSEEILGRPVFVTDYPKDIKAFYMRMNDDNETVRCVDLLCPGIGEIIGGSQREER